MTAAAHTLGPWRDDEGRSRVLAPSGAVVALVNVLAADGPEQHEANSRLIAGAPELLRVAILALEELRWADCPCETTKDELRRVIAAATTTPEGSA